MSTSIQELSEKVGRVGDIYASRHGIERSTDWYLLKLSEELGELTAEHLRLSGRARPHADGTQGSREALESEAADLLGQLLLYCRAQQIDIEAAITRKWLRYLND
ncbi:hypothetical protein [Devosia sp.]|uniref:hypothetical protein n=1 Tax=Devosia sp. TaxID=1871048 RepID=UPI003A8EE56D